MVALDYEAVPYPGQAVTATSPASLALASRVHGGPRPDLDGPLTMLEVGCGDGANLLPLAFFHPEWRFVGIDTSARAIEVGRAGARALGLDNLELIHGALESFASERPFDAIVAHGVYSWIDPSARSALRRLMADRLAPDGLAYVSFNALPAWGIRGRVRDALVRRGVADAAEARARLERWLTVLGAPGDHYAVLLEHELRRALDASDAYLTHEYLAPHNDAFWLGDVVADFDGVGLRYLGDADFATTGWVPPGLRAQLADAPGPVDRDEQIDLLKYRQHRAALFARDAGAPAGPEILDEAWLACVVRRRNDPFDATDGGEEIFDGYRAHEIRVESALSKVALLVMADRYPEGFRFDALVARSRERLDDAGIAPERGDVQRLTEGLWRLFEAGELELRLEAPPLRITPGTRPEASPLTRWEARAGTALTTPLHGTLPLEPVDRALIARMDGRDLSSLPDAVIADGVELEGAPAGAERARPVLAARAEHLVTVLGWWGLLRG